MDHLKTFEGFFDFLKRNKNTKDTQDIKKDNLLYEVMEGDTGQKWVENHEKLEFTVKEIEKIGTYFPKMDFCVANDFAGQPLNIVALAKSYDHPSYVAGFSRIKAGDINLQTLDRLSNGGSPHYSIYQFDVFVNVKFSIKKFTDEYYMIECRSNYILCDTFDGVIQFIENKEWKKYINNGTDFVGPR